MTKGIESYKKSIEQLQEKQRTALSQGDSATYERYGKDITVQLQNINTLTRAKENYERVLKLVTGETEEESEAIKKNAGLMEGLLGGTEKYNEIMALLPDPLKNVVSGLNGVTKASLKFIATPLGAIVAALTLAFKSLKTYLTKTEEGQQRLAKITGAFHGVMMALESVVAKVGKALYDAFTNPQKAIKDFKDNILQGLVERLKLVGGVFQNFGKVIAAVFSKEDTGEAWKEFTDSIKDLGATIGDDVVNTFNSAKDAAKNFGDEVKDAAAAMAEIEGKRLNLEIRESNWQVEKSKISGRKAELGDVFRDNTVSPEKRQAAYEEYLALVKRERDMEIGFANERIALKQKELDINDTNSIEDNKELNSLIAERNQIEAQYTSEIANTSRMRATIYRAAKNDEKELFNLIMSNREAQNSLLEESHQKRLNQIQIEYEKELQAIKDLKENWEKEQDGKLTKEQQGILDERTRLAGGKRDNSIEQLGETVYNKYKSLEDQRLDLEKEYNDDYDALWDAFLQTGDMKFLHSMEERTKAYEKSLRDIEKATDSALKLIFGDIDLMSKSTLDKAIEKAKEKLADLLKDPTTNASDIASMRSRLDDLISARTNYNFEGWGGSLTDLLRIGSRKESLEAQKSKDTDALKGLQEGSEGYKDLEENIKWADEGIKKLTEDQKKAAAAFATGELGKNLEKIGSALKQIGDLTEDNTMSNLGEAFSEVGGVVSNIANGFATGGLWGGIAAAAGTVVDKIMDAVVSAKIADAEFKKMTSDFESRLEMLKLKSKDYSNIFGTNSVKESQEAYANAAKALSSFITESNKLKNESFKSKDYSWWSNLFGKGDEYSSLKDFDIWGEDGLLNPDKARGFLSVWGDKLSESQRTQINHVLELKDAYDELTDTVKDYVGSLTGATASDLAGEMVDKFIRTGSAILDMSDNMDSFKRKMAESRVEALLMEKVFTQEAQDNITKLLMGNDVNGAIEAYNALLDEANSMSGEIETFLSGINVQAIEDQKATGGGFQTMNQDTGTELNGRFTALQISGENIEASMNDIAENFMAFSERFYSQFLAIDDIRNIQAQSLIELQGINENTLLALKPIREMNTTLGLIKTKVDKL